MERPAPERAAATGTAGKMGATGVTGLATPSTCAAAGETPQATRTAINKTRFDMERPSCIKGFPGLYVGRDF